jgi:hypothetical protein
VLLVFVRGPHLRFVQDFQHLKVQKRGLFYTPYITRENFSILNWLRFIGFSKYNHLRKTSVFFSIYIWNPTITHIEKQRNNNS